MVALAFSAAGITAQPTPQSSAPSGLIVGQVVDGTTGRPIAGAIVTIGGGQIASTNPSLHPGAQRVLTTPEGRFLFRDLPRGSVTLSAIKPGYVPGEYGRRRPDGGSQTITLAEGERVTDAVIRLWRYAAITGRAIDEAGEPIVGLQIRAFRRSFVSGRRRFVLGTAATTDDRGIYRLGDLVPGDYVVVSSGRQIAVPLDIVREWQGRMTPGVQELGFPVQPGMPTSIQLGEFVYSAGPGNAVPPPPSGDRLFVYPATYYSGATSAGQATIVTVASGEERASIDLELRPVPTLRASGVVAGPDGPTSNRAVRLLSPDLDDIALLQDAPATITDRSGAFSFAAVPAGQYTLAILPTARAMGPGNAADPVTWAKAPVALARSDVDGLAVVLENGLRVSGRFEFDGTRPRPEASAVQAVSIVLDPVESIVAGSGLGRTANPDASGEFTTFGVPGGRYLLRIPGSPVGWMFKSAMYNGRDISESPIDLQSDISGVVVTFTDRWTGVGGAVRNAQGNPDPSATVVVLSTDSTHWANGVNARRVKTARPDKNGQYGINSLPPGEYFIVALPDEQAGDWQDPRFLEAASAIASRFTIGDGERAAQDLRTKEIR